MPTKLPPKRRRAAPEPDEYSDAGDVLVPMLIICSLLFANAALYCEKFPLKEQAYTLASAPSGLQLGP